MIDGFSISNIGIALLLLGAVCAALPQSPFPQIISMIDLSAEELTTLGYVAYFFPFAEMVAALELWLVAVATWYGISLLARWIKLI